MTLGERNTLCYDSPVLTANASELRRIIVAIDGPAGAGKSTVSRRLAQRLGYQMLDTGAIYRAVALRAREQNVDWADGPGCARIAAELDIRFAWDGDTNRVFLGHDDVTAAIRTPLISQGASNINLTFVIEERHVPEAVRLLHAAFFECATSELLGHIGKSRES